MMPSTFDIETGARTLAMEARGEPEDGQVAVAWTIKNRVASGRWGHSMSSTCLWNRHIKDGGQVFQFSGWREEDPNFAYACALLDDDPVLIRMRNVLSEVMDAPNDPTGGALFYYAASMTPPPPWAATMRHLGDFGHQRFFTDKA